MPSFKGSLPFSLSGHDWLKIGKGAALAIVGAVAAFTTANVLPELRDHVASDAGLLIVTIIGAIVPILLNIATKYLSDTTTVVKALLLALTLSLVCTGTASAADGSVNSDLFSKITADPLLLAAVLLGATIFASKVLHINLAPLVIPFLTHILSPTPTPAPGPIPTPLPVPSPNDPFAALVAQILALLTQAQARGDKDSETRLIALLDRFTVKA